jgi:hypothetical protein
MSLDDISKYIEELPDDVVEHMTFSVPWQFGSGGESSADPDGFHGLSASNFSDMDLEELRQECWKKFNDNPQINTAVRGLVGRLVGLGFETCSEVDIIQDVVEETEKDPRNRLYHFWPKMVARNHIEGEMPLCLTVHRDGFVEVDFIRPGAIEDIIFHPFKTMMPLFYNARLKDESGIEQIYQIPSIYIAHYPKELIRVAGQNPKFNKEQQRTSIDRRRAYKGVGKYFRFIINWDRGYIQERSASYLRTVLRWLNKYEMLKNWEIDYKRAASSYLWVVKVEDIRKFRNWMALSDEDKAKTGLTAKKTPGGTLVLPPGFDLVVKNPNLPNITDSDTDILDMVSSGLNESVNTMMGKSQGTYASAKEHRGPMTDRTSDEIAYFERFLRHDFWGSVFFLKHKVARFPRYFRSWEAISFDKNGQPKFGYKKRQPEELIEFSFPTSEMIDYEARAKGLLGTKHGPLSETTGVPLKDITKRMGFGGYGRMRLRKATEEKRYPKLIYTMDAESLQERVEGEAKQGEHNNAKQDSPEEDADE